MENLHGPHLVSGQLHFHLVLAEFNGQVVHDDPWNDVLNAVIGATVLQQHQRQMKQVVILSRSDTLIRLLKKSEILDALHQDRLVIDSVQRLLRVAFPRFFEDFISVINCSVEKSREILGKFSRVVF